MGAQLFHVDGPTDMTRLIAAFCKLANAPKIQTSGHGKQHYVVHSLSVPILCQVNGLLLRLSFTCHK